MSSIEVPTSAQEKVPGQVKEYALSEHDTDTIASGGMPQRWGANPRGNLKERPKRASKWGEMHY
jgi:hypothetical protein